MEDVVGLLASAIVTQVGANLGTAVGDQVTLLCTYKDDLKDMKETLKSMEAVLKDAEGRSLKDGEVRLWLKRLKNVALDISDMLDEFDTNNDKNAGSRKMMGMCSSPTIAPKISVACKMKTIRERLKKIKYEHDSFSFNSSPNINEQKISDRRETTSKVNQADVVGRDNEKNYIIGLLSASNCKETVILPIHGFGGMGKTTLAQLVYNDDRFREYDHRVWVYVSQVFELKEIGNSIIAQVSKEGRKTLITLQEINLRLNELLCGKETLIVLDDIWEENEKDLDELKLMLDVGSRMKVIVTTRREDIARKVCSKSITPYELKPLDKESCWQIINKTSHFETKAGRKELEQIGRDIANKCGGIPLAAKSLGCMLRDNTEWSAVRDSDIWNEYSPADNNNSPQSAVISSLKLTYKIMPPYLRLCFAYCAIFPKGHSITSNDLIHQWISLDFIKPSNMLSATQLGNKCVRELLAMSFLQHSGLPSAHMILTVHDMVHEVARSVMNEDLIVFDGSGKKGNNTREQEDCRYALLTNCEDLPKMSTILLAKLRALHFRKCCKLEICGEEFSFFKCLRVLDLTECSVTMFPTSVGRLKQLRYLIAPKLQNPRFPKSIVQLSKLQYLSLHGSSQMLEIPESIVKIKCLMHIDLSNCSSIIGLPETLCGLTTLEYLKLSNCSNLEKLPEDLGSLTKLQFLNLSGCHKIELPKSTGKLTNLVHLDLSSCSKVKSLPKVLGGLTKLKYLNLSNQLNYIWRSIECISALTNLEYLDLSDNDNLIYLPENLGMLKKLHTLDLSGCRFLQSLPAKISEMHSLKFLFTARCSDKLKNYLTQHRLGKNIVSLPHFVVRLHDDRSCSNLHQLEDINPKVLEISCLENVRYTEEAKGIAILEKHNLSTLAFHWTPNADRLLEDKEVLGELVPPIDVKDFELKGYGSIQFPIWLMGISHYLSNLVAIKLQDLSRCSELPPLGQLPNLAELHLERLSSIKKINGDFCGGNGAFCKLLDFSLWDMEVLEEWITKYHDKDGAMVFMFPKLCTLSIRDCPRMALKPCPPIFEECWSIERSDKVISSYSISSIREGKEEDDKIITCSPSSSSTSFTPIRTIRISSIREGKEEDDKIITCSPSSSSTSFTPIRTIRLVVVSSELPLVQWRLLHYLPILEELEIRYCHHLAEFPDGTEVPERCHDHMSCKLTSHKSQIRFCDHMKEPADCKPPKQSPQCDSHVLCKLTSLKSLIVRRCNNITSLPDCIQKLTGLKRLEISYNPELMRWCDLERNKKLFHIQQVSKTKASDDNVVLDDDSD